MGMNMDMDGKGVCLVRRKYVSTQHMNKTLVEWSGHNELDGMCPRYSSTFRLGSHQGIQTRKCEYIFAHEFTFSETSFVLRLLFAVFPRTLVSALSNAKCPSSKVSSRCTNTQYRILRDFECSRQPGTFKINTGSFFVQRKPGPSARRFWSFPSDGRNPQIPRKARGSE